jgi:hypothetical protein
MNKVKMALAVLGEIVSTVAILVVIGGFMWHVERWHQYRNAERVQLFANDGSRCPALRHGDSTFNLPTGCKIFTDDLPLVIIFGAIFLGIVSLIVLDKLRPIRSRTD